MTWFASILALALVLPATNTHAQQTRSVTRDYLGREVFTTTRTRDSVVVRDRLGREVLTTRKEK